ncbi:purine and uridine phosphorylase [Cenococcum geophilum 1.58]|uniref:purine and uridine phosphorylase n=1 Tax=Cenococcum geophilum 1.58 TaxID=794803 RepID=UPI0035900071|nr:purine and uridine phosphorylase [Cenococcum geophilum 1.58]
MAVRRPSGRKDFEIGIICALPPEYDAVSLIFDEFWDEDGDPYGKATGDHNYYTTGRIGKYNVVLALLSHIGKTNATSAAHSLRLSYSGLWLVLLVGICGRVPRVGAKEILLGNVVISKTIVQYDFSRRYPNGFIRKDTIKDNLSKPNKEVRNLLVMFKTDRKYNYPGTAEDKLFESNYTHGREYRRTPSHVCDESFNLSCEEPAIYVGPIALGDIVIKSREDRDTIARKEGVIAFEMEAVGVWEELPCCIIIKGNFAAATASSVTKVLLERLIQEDKPLAPAMRDGGF